MRFIDRDAIRRALTFPVLVDAIEAAHRRPKIAIEDAMMGDGRYFVRHAVDPGRHFCSKLITLFPDNPARGNLAAHGSLPARGSLPTVQAVCVLFDGADGRPLATIDGTEITYWRTAADSALGSRLLSRPDAATLTVLGAGAMAPWLVRAHRAVRPSLTRVLVWNRGEERARALAEALRAEGVAAEVETDIDRAVGEADVLTACTRSRDPIVKGARVKAGAHIDLVGGYTRDMREADDDAMRRARVFVDRRESAFDVGDVLAPIASGAIAEKDVLGDIYDLVGGKTAGRRSAEEITLYKNAGGGHFDLIACEVVHRLA